MAVAGLMTLVGCQLDRGNVATVDSENIVPAKIVEVPATPLVLDFDTPVTFGWEKADYGYSAAVTYTFEAGYEGNYVLVGQTTDTTFTVKGDVLNAALTANLGAPDGAESTFTFRVKSQISADERFDAVSEPISLAVTTFSGDPAEVYTVGSHQGWDPNTGIPLYSEKSDGVYVGWVWLYNMYDAAAPAEYAFLTEAGNWASKIAADADKPHTIENLKAGESGVANISPEVATPSLYYIKLDVNNVTGEYLYQDITTIGLIGDATPGVWDSDTDLTYDPDTKTFVATGVAMTNGSQFKLRANDAWTISWGGGAEPGTFNAEPVGDNIVFSEPTGTYTVVVDMFKFVPTYEFIAE